MCRSGCKKRTTTARSGHKHEQQTDRQLGRVPPPGQSGDLHPAASLALPAIAAEVPNPFQARANRPTVPVLTADGRSVSRRHIVDGLPPVAIDQSGTIRCAVTGHTLWIAPGSPTDQATLGEAEP